MKVHCAGWVWKHPICEGALCWLGLGASHLWRCIVLAGSGSIPSVKVHCAGWVWEHPLPNPLAPKQFQKPCMKIWCTSEPKFSTNTTASGPARKQSPSRTNSNLTPAQLYECVERFLFSLSCTDFVPPTDGCKNSGDKLFKPDRSPKSRLCHHAIQMIFVFIHFLCLNRKQDYYFSFSLAVPDIRISVFAIRWRVSMMESFPQCSTMFGFRSLNDLWVKQTSAHPLPSLYSFIFIHLFIYFIFWLVNRKALLLYMRYLIGSAL